MKVGVWALGLYPLVRVLWPIWREGFFGGGLGADPIQRVLDHTGWWTIIFLITTLAVTPARRITGRNELIKLRRLLGLFAFFYATLHFSIYVGLDQFFGWDFILEDIVERPFITFGFLAWVVLLALAVTSTRGWIRRLGKGWTRLHRLVYLAGLLGVIHYYWRVKADTRAPAVFAAIFVALMLLRLRWPAPKSNAPPRREPGGASGRSVGAGAGSIPRTGHPSGGPRSPGS